MDVKKLLNTISLVCGIIGGTAKVATLSMDFVAQASEWKRAKDLHTDEEDQDFLEVTDNVEKTN